jgi:hypothetical protein
VGRNANSCNPQALVEISFYGLVLSAAIGAVALTVSLCRDGDYFVAKWMGLTQ